MSKFSQHLQFEHNKPHRIGVLLTNLGTPSAPTVTAIRRYLREFLSDPRVIEIPKPIWQVILNTFILPIRPFKLKHSYQSIWTQHGSPLLSYSLSLRDKLSTRLQALQQQDVIKLAFGLRYGQPSIELALQELYAENCQYIFVLPMYPQYSATTTGSTFDAVTDFFQQDRFVPNFKFLNHYCDHPHYILAIAQQIKDYLKSHGKPDKFIFSFHGLPYRNLLLGDPYHCQCHKTGRLIAEAAGLAASDWQVTFQSRFGKAKWLQPYTDKTMQALGADKTKHIAVLCPGFPIDCLETLEEIQMQNQAIFKQAGGQHFDYIPCLNDSEPHVEMLFTIIKEQIESWLQPKLACPQLLQARQNQAEQLAKQN